MLIAAIHQINRNKTPSFSTCTVRKPHAPCSIFARKCQCNEFQVSNPLKYMYIVSNFKHTTWAGIYISIRNYDPLLEALPFPRVFKCVPFSFSLFFWSYEWKWGNNLIMNGRLKNKMQCFFNTRYREFPASTPIPHVRPSAAARARERSKSVLLKKQTKVF